MTENPRRSQVCHEHCLDVHAQPVAVENFQDATGIDPYTLAWDYSDDPTITPRWDEVTTETSWQAFDRMIEDVAIDYLLEGNVDCQRADWPTA